MEEENYFHSKYVLIKRTVNRARVQTVFTKKHDRLLCFKYQEKTFTLTTSMPFLIVQSLNPVALLLEDKVALL